MRAQVSLEAVFAFSMAVIIFVSLFNLNWARLYTARDIGEAGEAKMVGEYVAEMINTVYANGDGFSIHLSPEILNYTRLGDVEGIRGIGISLPIVVDTGEGTVNISKSMAKTGGGNWTATVPIIPTNITLKTPTAENPETTIRNSANSIEIYANQANIDVR